MFCFNSTGILFNSLAPKKEMVRQPYTLCIFGKFKLHWWACLVSNLGCMKLNDRLGVFSIFWASNVVLKSLATINGMILSFEKIGDDGAVVGAYINILIALFWSFAIMSLYDAYVNPQDSIQYVR